MAHLGQGGIRGAGKTVPGSELRPEKPAKPNRLVRLAGRNLKDNFLHSEYRRDCWNCQASNVKKSGESGIRTHGEVTPTTVFKTVPLNRSGISPRAANHYTLTCGQSCFRGNRAGISKSVSRTKNQ